MSTPERVSFEEFKLYYDSAERVTDRRLETNRWNYSICAALLLALAAIIKWGVTSVDLVWIGLIAVVLLCGMAVLSGDTTCGADGTESARTLIVRYVCVITPVSLDPDFESKCSIIAELSADTGLQPLFPLDRSPGIALERAASDIRDSLFVLADLTYERPSCYFELGVAEAARKDVAIMAKQGTTIHQVGYTSQVRFYRDLADYRRLIATVLEERTAPLAAAAAKA